MSDEEIEEAKKDKSFQRIRKSCESDDCNDGEYLWTNSQDYDDEMGGKKLYSVFETVNLFHITEYGKRWKSKIKFV